MRTETVTGYQEDAIADILALPEQGRRAAGFRLTLLNRNPRRVQGIRTRFMRRVTLRCGSTEAQAARQWADVKDMAKLQAVAE